MMVNLLNILLAMPWNAPGDNNISSLSPSRSISRAFHPADDERADLPPEMYINQQKWLELRATRKSLLPCLCNNVNIIS